MHRRELMKAKPTTTVVTLRTAEETYLRKRVARCRRWSRLGRLHLAVCEDERLLGQLRDPRNQEVTCFRKRRTFSHAVPRSHRTSCIDQRQDPLLRRLLQRGRSVLNKRRP